jgi:DNA replicative helicase MCM subunit Mcm2 (Cdc46/Mcm family)
MAPRALKKYLAYAKSLKPKLTNSAAERITSCYDEIRMKSWENRNTSGVRMMLHRSGNVTLGLCRDAAPC